MTQTRPVTESAGRADTLTAPGLILVTGGTGNTGGRLADLLDQRGVQVRIASRHQPPSTDPAATREHVRFDWLDPATYPAAVSGVERLYLLRPSGPVEQTLPLIRQFLAAATRAGVRRVVLLHSAVNGPAGSPEIAEAVHQAMPEWAILRPSWFMQNFTGAHPIARGIQANGQIVTATGDGRVGFIDAGDIAGAAAETLLLPAAPNDAYLLTGPEALSYSQVADILSEVAGRPIRHVNLSAEHLTAQWIAAGLPEAMARTAVELDLAVSRGDYDHTTTTVHDLTGRPARSLIDHARTTWHPQPAPLPDRPATTPPPGSQQLSPT